MVEGFLLVPESKLPVEYLLSLFITAVAKLNLTSFQGMPASLEGFLVTPVETSFSFCSDHSFNLVFLKVIQVVTQSSSVAEWSC
jgi:hypothetical protein